MADYDYDDDTADTDEQDDGGRTITLNRKQIRSLEQKAKRTDELEARLASYEMAGAFEEAGFDLDDPAHELFFRDYDGEADAGAIMAAATAKGWKFEEGDVEGSADSGFDLDGSEAGSGGSMAEELEEAARVATSQNDLNDRIINIYRAYGETVSTDV